MDRALHKDWLDNSRPRWSEVFNHTVPAANANVSIPNNVFASFFGKYGQLVSKAKLRAPALVLTACRNFGVPVNYTEVRSRYQSFNQAYTYFLRRNSFVISLSLVIDGHEAFNLVTAYADQCTGTLNLTTCMLASAIGEYDVTVSDSIVALDEAANPTIIAMANNTRVSDGVPDPVVGLPSNLGVIVQLAYGKWDGSVLSEGKGTQVSGQAFEGFLINRTDCHLFEDPQREVLESLNTIMVLLALLLLRVSTRANCCQE